MGTYHSSHGDNRQIGECILTAVQDFAEDLLKASEIEYIDMKEIQQENLPIVFYMVNISIDKVLKSMKDRIPEMVPPMREYKKKSKEKENKDKKE
jgi:hypothetical protein